MAVEEIELPTLRIDPGAWELAADGGLTAHIVLGTCQLVLEAREVARASEPADRTHETDIDGHPYRVAAFRV